jgi:hypothetical protein
MPRTTCPYCGRDVPLRGGRIGYHKDQTGKSSGYWCDGYRKQPVPDHLVDLEPLVDLVEAHIRLHARDIAAQIVRARIGPADVRPGESAAPPAYDGCGGADDSSAATPDPEATP